MLKKIMSMLFTISLNLSWIFVHVHMMGSYTEAIIILFLGCTCKPTLNSFQLHVMAITKETRNCTPTASQLLQSITQQLSLLIDPLFDRKWNFATSYSRAKSIIILNIIKI
jgi:hypothetical protein